MRYFSVLITIIFMSATPVLTACNPPELITETETLKEIRQINKNGFGDGGNKYAWAMATLNGTELFVGTNNFDLDFETPPDPEDPTKWEGCEIWRYDGVAWDNVVDKGLDNNNNIGIRGMKELNGCLYAATMNLNDGMELWRSCNGSDWEILITNGFGYIANYSSRALGYFKGHYYVGTINAFAGSQIWRSGDGSSWDMVAENGISDPDNVWLAGFIEHDGWLYVGTAKNAQQGMQIYRTLDGLDYEMVYDGSSLDPADTHAMTLYAFNDKIFVGTMNRTNGCSIYVSEDGINFVKKVTNGFGTPQNSYLWSLQEYNNRLYAGTFYEYNLFYGNFHLYSSADGEEWILENSNALGYIFHYGIRSMEVFNNKLILGTATAFYGCKVIEAAAK